MRYRIRWWLPAGLGAFASALALVAPMFTAPTLASAAAIRKGPVSTSPARGTPHLVKTSGKPTENVRQLVRCGGRMYAVGRFATILQDGHRYTRHNVFSFSATAPYKITSWRPDVNGEVNSIAFTKSRGCGHAYLGGSFTSVGRTAAANIAEVSTKTGAVVTGFRRSVNGAVETMLGYKGHVLVGGHFTRTNGTSRPYYESLSPSTGKVDGFLNMHIRGHVHGFPTLIYNQQLSPGGRRLLAEGNFTSVAGHPRQQIFMLDLSGSRAKLTGWTSPLFSEHCRSSEAFYLRAAAWSPSGAVVYTASTGEHLLHWNHTFPLTGLCDAVGAFPSAQKSVSPTWVEYDGCDSYYSVAAGSGIVFAGGHPRWGQNQNGCNNRGAGAVTDRGMQGLKSDNGHVLLNRRGTGKYYMSRANADDMLITDAGLWIASSNRFGSDKCVGASNHAGICFLPRGL